MVLRARYRTDRQHIALLGDELCPRIIVDPYESRSVSRAGAYNDFVRLLRTDPLFSRLIEADVTVEGLVTRISDPRDRSAIARYRIDIVRYIEVTPLP